MVFLNGIVKEKYFIVLILPIIGLFIGCATIQGINDLNTLPENLIRGDPENTDNSRRFLNDVLINPEGRKIKVYNRRSMIPTNPKGIFDVHSFYVFFKDGNLEHTLVFSNTPRGSKYKGCWMLDAKTDLDSYNLYIYSDNPWEVEEYKGPNGETDLDMIITIQKIIEKIDEGHKFFGLAIVRTLPWYHHLWLFLVPPPIIAYGPLLIASLNTENCTTAILDTMVWE
jgi:hypothetical protein